MTIKRVNIGLTAVLALLMATIFIVRRDYAERNTEWLPGMVASVSYQPYSENPNFANGQTMQRPLPGTIVRGVEPFSYNATPEDAARAGRELRSPLKPEERDNDLARGAMVFATYCSPCHGAGGVGDGPVAQRGYPPPPSLMAPQAMKLADGQIYHIISLGQRNMPSLSAQVARLDRWKVIQYVRSMQQRSTTAQAVK